MLVWQWNGTKAKSCVVLSFSAESLLAYRVCSVYVVCSLCMDMQERWNFWGAFWFFLIWSAAGGCMVFVGLWDRELGGWVEVGDRDGRKAEIERRWGSRSVGYGRGKMDLKRGLRQYCSRREVSIFIFYFIFLQTMLCWAEWMVWYRRVGMRSQDFVRENVLSKSVVLVLCTCLYSWLCNYMPLIPSYLMRLTSSLSCSIL